MQQLSADNIGGRGIFFQYYSGALAVLHKPWLLTGELVINTMIPCICFNVSWIVYGVSNRYKAVSNCDGL